MAARSWTVGGLVREGARRFRRARLAFGHGTTNARDEAAWLVLHTLGLPFDADASKIAAPRAAGRVLDVFDRRIRSRKPAAYLTREAWLGKLRFYVDERVVVPRSHVAGLLDERLAPWITAPGAIRSALDLCTGSGCLAVLLARAFPRARVDAADLSPAALAVARINIGRHRLKRRVRPVRSDLFSALRGKRYDLIISNPPYVTAARMKNLPREYRHEPAVGLGGGRDGLDYVRRILAEAPAHLNPGGLLVVEVGSGRRRVQQAFPRVQFAWPETAAGHAV
ncbi:MAG TPA: 50S ribosomal protein L3 N(5)-glutamine methyltransferase, partial [Burkholderiales bacterium]|nr:50S ribosomal protein L3 N(5)-glutamine methyltransferase [Burkholderiales bacterium]